MNKLINLKGQKFERLTVKSLFPKRNRNGNAIWICKCDCGDSFSVVGYKLKAKEIFQCRKCFCKSMQLNGYISKRYIYDVKARAKIRNIYFDKKIDREYLWKLFLKQWKCNRWKWWKNKGKIKGRIL